jgi:hypothetical protein
MSLAFYNRLAAMVTRLRGFQRECLESLEQAEADHSRSRSRAVLNVLREQTDGVLGRARLLQGTLSCLLSAIGCMVLCSVFLGLSPLNPALQPLATALFFGGSGLVFMAVCFALAEIRQALRPIVMESEFVRAEIDAALAKRE